MYLSEMIDAAKAYFAANEGLGASELKVRLVNPCPIPLAWGMNDYSAYVIAADRVIPVRSKARRFARRYVLILKGDAHEVFEIDAWSEGKPLAVLVDKCLAMAERAFAIPA